MESTSIRDRSEEFFKFAESVKKRLAPLAQPPANTQKEDAATLESRRVFSAKAQVIGSKIHQTSTKLEKLTKLSQNKSLFDDPSAEIQQLTFFINQDIASLNQDILELSQLQASQAGNQQTSKHSEQIIGSLKGNLLQTTEDFQSVLKLRTQNMKEQDDRRRKYTSMNAPALMHGEMRQRNVGKAEGTQGGFSGLVGAQPNLYEEQAASGEDVVIDFGGSGGGESSMLTQTMYTDSRATALQNVEKTIAELGTIFSQLAAMVSMQAETIERIDANVEESLGLVDDGHNSLLRRLKDVSGNRALILKIFAVLFVTLVLSVLFL